MNSFSLTSPNPVSRKIGIVLFCALFLAFNNGASAGWESIPSTAFTVSPPPRTGSAAERQDFELLHQHQRERTEAECVLANQQAYPSFHVLYVEHSDLLTAREVTMYEPIVTRVMEMTERVTRYHKKKHARPRPFNTDPTLTPCTPKPSGATSYPSSHASMASAGACILSWLFPDRNEGLTRLGRQGGDLRAVAGVHHPSDVKAGQDLALAICERLIQEEDFLKEIRSSTSQH